MKRRMVKRTILAVVMAALLCSGTVMAEENLTEVLTEGAAGMESGAAEEALMAANAQAEAEAAAKAQAEAEAAAKAQAEAEAAAKAQAEAEATAKAQAEAEAAAKAQAEAEAAAKAQSEAEAAAKAQAEADAAAKAQAEADAAAKAQAEAEAAAKAQAEAAAKAQAEADAAAKAREEAAQTMKMAAVPAPAAPAASAPEQISEPLQNAQTAVQEPAPASGTENKPEEQNSQPQKIDGLPLQLKAELPKQLTKGEFYEITVEIINPGERNLENLQLTLHSPVSGYVFTSYHTLEEAQREIGLRGIVREGEERNDERIIGIGFLGGYTSLKEEHVIVFAAEDAQMADGTFKAEAKFEMTCAGTEYYGKGEWKIVREPEQLPEGDPNASQEGDPNASQEGDPDAVSENDPEDISEELAEEDPETVIFLEEEEKSGDLTEEQEEDEAKATVLEEEIDQMQAVAAVEVEVQDPEEPQILMEEEPSDDEEMITVEVIGDGEEETEDEELIEDWEDWGYYDDWTTYSSYGEGQVISTATPYVLVKSYSHKKTIHTGDDFGMEIEFLNTSQKSAMDNVVIKVDTSEALSLASGTNTMFINDIPAGGTITKRLSLAAASECKEPNQSLKLSISFEYVENGERKKGEAEESITLPISPKDRLELQDPVYDEMQAGKEGVISIAYVNKGYTSLHNMEAVIDMDNADAVQKTIYAGNIDSGKNGTIDFLVTPEMDGEYSGTVTLKYEDSSQKEVSVVVPLAFTSTMAYVEEEPLYEEEAFAEEEYEQKSASVPLIVSIAAAACIALVTAVLVIRKKRKGKTEQDVDLDDWFSDNHES